MPGIFGYITHLIKKEISKPIMDESALIELHRLWEMSLAALHNGCPSLSHQTKIPDLVG